MPEIEEFWIINWSGTPLFSYSPSIKLEFNIMSSFFSALQSFAVQLIDEKKESYVNAIAIGEYNYNFLSHSLYQVYFVSKSLKSLKPKNIKTHLQNIASLFINKYGEELFEFDGEVTKFEAFLDEFHEYFKGNFKKLKGIW